MSGRVLSKQVKAAKILFVDGFRHNRDTDYWNAITQRLKQHDIHDAERLPTNGARTHAFNAPIILNGVLQVIQEPNGPRNVILIPHSKGAADADVAFSRRYMKQQGKTAEETALVEKHLAIGSLQGLHGFAHQSNDAMVDPTFRYLTIDWVSQQLAWDPASLDEMTYYGRHNTRVQYPRNPNIKYFALATYDRHALGEYPNLARTAEMKYRTWRDPLTFEPKEIDVRNDGRLFWPAQLPGNTPYALVSGALHDLPFSMRDARKSADLIEALIRTIANRRAVA